MGLLNKSPSDSNPQKVKLGREWGSVADHAQREALPFISSIAKTQTKQNKSPQMNLGTEASRQWG